MPDMGSTPKGRSGRNPVKQLKGPGMNRGLPKRRPPAKPKPFKPMQLKTEMGSSLLPSGMSSHGGKVISKKEF
jgi:hypothetical protein